MSFGMTIGGLASTLEVFNALKMQIGDEAAYIAGPTVNYAVENEFGTANREARPFVRPAAERVQANPQKYVEEIASTQGIDISSEDDVARAAAIAVQNEAKKIADEKDIRDTGQLINSISFEKVE